MPTGAHLVGSLPLADADAVFRAAAETLGDRLRTIPDGETGERTIWIQWQAGVFAEHPDLEVNPVPEGQYAPFDQYRLRAGADPAHLRFERLGYAEQAERSFARFAELQQEGAIADHVRLQVSLPTPAAPVTQVVAPDWRAAVEPAYEEALLREVDQLARALPHDRLAVQWDVAIEVGMWEGLGGLFTPWFDDVHDAIIERLARISARVPDDVALGYHLCYGDYGHEHFVQPADTANLVALANRLSEAVGRPIAWVHLPVPRERDDAAYFAPLRDLRLHPETQLHLGLVHHTDGAEGARRRIAAAQDTIEDFGVATECGFGRRPAEQVRPLLELHRELTGPVAS